MRFGWFLGSHVLIGGELTGSWHRGVGTSSVHDASHVSDGMLREATYTAVLPLGVFVEV